MVLSVCSLFFNGQIAAKGGVIAVSVVFSGGENQC